MFRESSDRGNAVERSSASPPAARWTTGKNGNAEQILDGLNLTPRNWLVFGLCCAGLFFESLNLQLMSFIAPMLAEQWKLSSGQVGLVISAAILGMMAGTFAFGAFADRFGRRAAFQITVALFSLVTAWTGLAMSLWQLCIGRFLAGLGLGGSIPVETAVLSEFTPARHRTRMLALWAVALPVGGLIAPLCVGLVPKEFGWRGLLLLGGLPAILVLLARRKIPETPLFLASRGDLPEALSSLRWVGGRQISHIAMLEPSFERAGNRAKRARGLDVALLDAETRSATLIAWALNFGSFFAYYGLILWLPSLLGTVLRLPQAMVLQIMFATALAGLIGRMCALSLAGSTTRETLVASFSLLGAASLTLLAFQLNSWAIALFAATSAFFLEGVFSSAIPFVAELYPPHIRATGVGWAGGFGRFGTALAPIIVGILVDFSPVLAILALAVGSLVTSGSVILWKSNVRKLGG